MDKSDITALSFVLFFGFMLGWLFTIYVAGRFDTFGVAANWQNVSKSCFSAVEEQGKLIDRLALSNESIESKLPVNNGGIKNGTTK
jgi:hypothetical protein